MAATLDGSDGVCCRHPWLLGMQRCTRSGKSPADSAASRAEAAAPSSAAPALPDCSKMRGMRTDAALERRATGPVFIMKIGQRRFRSVQLCRQYYRFATPISREHRSRVGAFHCSAVA